MEDNEIIELYFERNEVAIKETDKKYGKYLNKIAMNILDNLNDSEECVNDTYFKTWNTIPPKRPNIFKIFLARITRNSAINTYNAKNTLKRGKNYAQVEIELNECINENSTIESLDYEFLVDSINNFLSTISKEQRILFVRRYFYFESIKDISMNFSLSESNVKVTLMRIRNNLKSYLKEGGLYE